MLFMFCFSSSKPDLNVLCYHEAALKEKETSRIDLFVSKSFFLSHF